MKARTMSLVRTWAGRLALGQAHHRAERDDGDEAVEALGGDGVQYQSSSSHN